MKIAVSASDKNLDLPIEQRFGRCNHFIIIDPLTMEFEAIENTGVEASGGTGIKVVTDASIIIRGNDY